MFTRDNLRGAPVGEREQQALNRFFEESAIFRALERLSWARVPNGLENKGGAAIAKAFADISGQSIDGADSSQESLARKFYRCNPRDG